MIQKNVWFSIVALLLLAAEICAEESHLQALQAAPEDIVVNRDSSTNDTMPSMAVLSDGSTWVAWHAFLDRRDRVLARRLGPEGLGPIQSISGKGDVHDAPVLISTGDATAWVFWETQSDGRWRLMGRQLKQNQWQAAVVLSESDVDAMMPAAVSLGGGRVLLAWSACKAGRFRIYHRTFQEDVWSEPIPTSSQQADSFRPAVVAQADGRAWVFWDSYQEENYVVEGRALLPELGKTERISATGAYGLTPTAIATRQGLCVAWLQLEDVISATGVVSQMHTLRMAIRGKQDWQLVRDAEKNSVAATLTHGIMVKIEPRPEWKGGYMGRCRVPMLVEKGESVYLLWDRKRNPTGHPALADGELVARPCREGQWGKTTVLHQGLVDYHVATNPESEGEKFFVLASDLPRHRRRIYHRLVVNVNRALPFQQEEWLGWRPVKLPLPVEHQARHEIRHGGKTYQLYWADLHNHGTLTCDAEGEVDELLRYARDRARIDVVAITDNDEVFDDPLTETEYAKATFFARNISRTGKFLALPAYEWTSHVPTTKDVRRDDPRGYDFQSRAKLGFINNHRTVIYPLAGGPLLRHTEAGNDIRELHKVVDAASGLALTQHASWVPTRHPSEAGVEVTSAWAIYLHQPGARDLYHKYLDEGYRYAFMGHSDSHRRNPGLGGALTGVYAESLTDKAILDAIRNRRVFATNGSQIILDARVNGELMGSETHVDNGQVKVALDVLGTQPIVHATLVRDGEEIKTFSGNGEKRFHAVFEDEHLAKGTHWYYWHVAQEGTTASYHGNAQTARGHLAWSSPQWVTVDSVAAKEAVPEVATSEEKTIERRADAPKPLTPEKSVQQFQLPQDLRIELAAAEPLVVDPSAIAFDEQGQMFVCEIHGYNLEGHLDVQELNKSGKLDQEVRRIPASSGAKKAAEEETYGTVKLLIDTDGDGRMDRAQVWADRLPPCHGLIAARGGVIVICRPDILYLADRDGDGRAEVRETLFTNFAITALERSINNPRFGLDNWIYVASGNSGGRITGPQLAKAVQLGATDFRFKPDGSAIEPVTGRNFTFGLTFNDWGDRFLIKTTSPALHAVPLPYRYLLRNPYAVSPSESVNLADYNQVYPTSKPHPWRLERSQKKAWAKFYGDRYGAAESAANGYFTAACGQLIYRADALSKKYRGNLFSCEPAQNLIHRDLIERKGLYFKVHRAPGEETSEFLTSNDQWFRPTNLLAGPEGAIYVVDMYREIIEDYSAIPRYLQQQYGLIEGSNFGRIWRIVAKDRAQAPADRKWPAQPTNAELVAELSSPNAWRRQTAQRLLVERGDKTVAGQLADLVQDGKTPQARLHALYTLEGLNALEPSVAQHAIDDDHFAVRLHALRLSERWLDQRPALLQKVFSRVDDPDAKVRLQLALTLGETHDERALEILQKLAVRDAAEPWMQAAILSSVAEASPQLLSAILHPTEGSGARDFEGRVPLLSGLASIVGARHEDDKIGNLLQLISLVPASEDGEQSKIQVACLTGLMEGLQRGKSRKLESAEGGQALLRLLASPIVEIRTRALQVIGLVQLSDSPEVQAVFRNAAEEALDASQPNEARQAAIGLLASAPYATLVETAEQLLHPSQPLEVQLSAVRALSAAETPEVASVLLAPWETFTPAVQTAVLRAIFTRTNRLSGLLDAIEQGIVSPQSLGAMERSQLMNSSDAKIVQRAKTLLSEQVPLKSRELVERYRSALANPRDIHRGKAVFTKICSQCHQLEGQGNAVGPNLAAAKNRAEESLLLDILQPSAKITAGYQSYVVADTNGQVSTGVLTSETATSITLRTVLASTSGAKPGSVQELTLLRKDIDEMRASEQSLMPGSLEKEVTPQEMADLIAYLQEAQKSPSLLTLFDDDSLFLTLLTEGAGTATLSVDDKFTGVASLLVTPPQRFSAKIPDWEYRISENPGPGEFRYLRFSWKARGAGVMLELAANGQWPLAGQPTRRYFSGKNKTDWKATEVSSVAPDQWTTVTRDLWKDNGDFILTGIAPTAMGGEALFDHIQLLRSLEDVKPAQ